jgi:hypothetical protein
MRLFRLVLLSTAVLSAWGQTPVWDNSGNALLNGSYYFRQTTYVLSSSGTGALYDALALYGTVTFDGAGKYSMSVTLSDARGGLQRGTIPGTYSVAPGGQGFLSNPDQLGRNRTVYVYATASAPARATSSSPRDSSGGGVLVALLAVGGSILAAGAALVAWAHS